MATEKQEKECKICISNYEDWRFVYSYESKGKDVVLDVKVVWGEEDIEFHLNGKSIGLTLQDFVNCEDVDDCGLLIAQHIIKDNDGEVLTSFVDETGSTLTEIFYEKRLSKVLEYENGDMDDESLQLKLLANCGYPVNSYDDLEIPEKDVDRIIEMIKDKDNEGLFEYMNKYCYNTNEVLDMWGDEVLSYEICDEEANEIESGEVFVSPNNLFTYKDFDYPQIVNDEYHPEFLLIHKDEMKRSWATFYVPKDFKIGEIHFVDKYLIPQNYMLDWEKFGDYMTSIGVIQYRGKLYFAEDYGDVGSWGVNYFCLLKWNVEKKQYDLLAES